MIFKFIYVLIYLSYMNLYGADIRCSCYIVTKGTSTIKSNTQLTSTVHDIYMFDQSADDASDRNFFSGIKSQKDAKKQCYSYCKSKKLDFPNLDVFCGKSIIPQAGKTKMYLGHSASGVTTIGYGLTPYCSDCGGGASGPAKFLGSIEKSKETTRSCKTDGSTLLEIPDGYFSEYYCGKFVVSLPKMTPATYLNAPPYVILNKTLYELLQADTIVEKESFKCSWSK